MNTNRQVQFAQHAKDMIHRAIEQAEAMQDEDGQAEQDSNPVYCPMCDSGDSSYMGALGMMRWFRCNECGSDFSS